MPFELAAAERWRSAFVDDVEHACKTLDAGASVPGYDLVRGELGALAATVRSLGRIGVKDVVDACERAIAVELAAAERCRAEPVPVPIERD